ncbi:MAG TPA: DUF4124 domain-containing protein [Usitatibacter sp.]|nr:DUF4124 domain-containing protein [Usitatibacter sp.]
MPSLADAHLIRALLFLAALAVAGAAVGETRALYRWTDAEGRVQYADKPPAGFKGEVTRVDVDLDANTRPAAAPRAPLVAPEVLRDVIAPATDINKKRRDTREKLEAAVRAAEQKVKAAKAALDGGDEREDNENQVVQRRFARAQAGRSNCRPVTDANGRPAGVNCPAVVPSDEYYERIRGLEEALKKAEEELEAAQIAYRRGVD